MGGATTQVYAPVTGALTTKDAALDPSLLAAGAFGIYGLVEEDASSVSGALGMQALITEATDSTTGKMRYATFAAGSNIVSLYQGGNPSGYPVGVQSINRKGVYKIVKQAYVAPVKQISFIGYNGSTGSLNLPSIAANDDATVLAVQKEATTLDQIREQESYSSGGLLASTAAYDVIAPIVNAINNTPTLSKTHTAGITANGTVADFTGTATALLFTKGSTTVYFVIEDATAGWTASTGSVTANDVVFVGHANMKVVTFTANALGSGAGRHVITIAGTIYNVADAGTAAQNATAIAAAINAGTQATAVISGTSDVTITLVPSLYSAKMLVRYTADDASWSTLTLTVTSTGETVGTIYKAAATASTAASFELDRAYVGETGYWLGLTSTTLGTGIMTTQTEYGIKLRVDGLNGESYSYAKQGVIQNATLTYTLNASKGFGTGTSVAAKEESLMAYRGQIDTYCRWTKQLPRFADSNLTYTCYTLLFIQSTDTTGAPHNKTSRGAIEIYIPSGQSTLITSVEALFGGLFTDALLVGF